MLTPALDPIAYDAEYTVECNTGYELSGGSKMKCGEAGFDQTPSCIGELFSINLSPVLSIFVIIT